MVGVDDDDDDAAVTISSFAEPPESPPSQVQPTLVSASPVRNATCNQHLCSCRKSRHQQSQRDELIGSTSVLFLELDLICLSLWGKGK